MRKIAANARVGLEECRGKIKKTPHTDQNPPPTKALFFVCCFALSLSHSLSRPGRARQRAPQIKKTQDELQWIVAQRLLSALTIPGFS